jgi:hypothetical protein
MHHRDLDRDQADACSRRRAPAMASWPTTPEPPVRFTTLERLLQFLLQQRAR